MSVNNRGKKILLVDDDQGLRTVLAEQLDLYDGFTTIQVGTCLLYTSPSPRDRQKSRMPSSA